eukprot:COSAG02_NODE_5736_length_4079_cov_3.219598_2_plen_175_part_00
MKLMMTLAIGALCVATTSAVPVADPPYGPRLPTPRHLLSERRHLNDRKTRLGKMIPTHTLPLDIARAVDVNNDLKLTPYEKGDFLLRRVQEEGPSLLPIPPGQQLCQRAWILERLPRQPPCAFSSHPTADTALPHVQRTRARSSSSATTMASSMPRSRGRRLKTRAPLTTSSSK